MEEKRQRRDEMAVIRFPSKTDTEIEVNICITKSQKLLLNIMLKKKPTERLCQSEGRVNSI